MAFSVENQVEMIEKVLHGLTLSWRSIHFLVCRLIESRFYNKIISQVNYRILGWVMMIWADGDVSYYWSDWIHMSEDGDDVFQLR